MRASITIIRTKNITARLIHLGMWLWAVLRFKKPTKSYNHCEVRYGEMTSGAIADGVKTRPWAYYLFEHRKKYFDWIDYELNLTEEEWKRGKEYLDKVEGTPYEFENFWFHAIYIFTGKWLGSTTNKKLYCYEHGIRFINAAKGLNLDTNMNPYQFRIWADNNLI